MTMCEFDFNMVVFQVLADPDAAKYVDGIAVHWYNDAGNGPDRLDTTHNNHPNRFIHYTEVNLI